MKILVLVIITIWSFRHPYPPPQSLIVGSVKEAAMLKFKRKEFKVSIEPDHHEYRLYEVDFENRNLKQIPIPDITFKEVNHG